MPEDIVEAKRLYEEHTARTQAFFATLAAETRRPHFGERAAEVIRPLLIRAQEARLYVPEIA